MSFYLAVLLIFFYYVNNKIFFELELFRAIIQSYTDKINSIVSYTTFPCMLLYSLINLIVLCNFLLFSNFEVFLIEFFSVLMNSVIINESFLLCCFN